MGITIDPSMHNSQPNSFPAVSLFDLISDTPQEANNIMELIEGRIGLDGELIKDAKNSKFVSSSSNSAFGLLVLALGDKDRAEEIRNGIERRIGFEIFIRHSDRDRRVLYQSLIPYALLNLNLGDINKAEEIRNFIEGRRFSDSNLIGAGFGDLGILTVPNFLKFFLDFSLGFPDEDHIKEMEDEIGLDNGLIYGGVNYNRILSLPNSLYGLSKVPNKFVELISHRGG